MLSLALLRNGVRIANLPTWQRPVWRSTLRGFERLSATLEPLSLTRSSTLQTQLGTLTMQALYVGIVVWEGRVETVSFTERGCVLTALGHWRAYADLPHTALWSDTRTNAWTQDLSNYTGYTQQLGKFRLDTNNRLWITSVKSSTYIGAANDAAMWTYTIPSYSNRAITSFTASYAFLASSVNWKIAVRSRDASNAVLGTTVLYSGSGVLQTGTLSYSPPANTAMVDVIMYWAGATNVSPTGETGVQNYLSLTSVRVVSSSSVTANTIAAALVSEVYAVNPASGSASAVLINGATDDLNQVVYADANMQDILTGLATYGNASGQRYDVGVWEHKLLRLQPQGTGARTWFARVDDVRVEGDLATLLNSRYAVYQDANGITQRTSTSANATSVAQAGMTRRGAVAAPTTSSATADAVRAAALADTDQITPRAAIVVRRVASREGAPVPLPLIRAGDTIVLRNYPQEAAGAALGVAAWRIGETTYDAQRGELTLAPAEPLPTLDYVIAQLNA